jgi:hypothetical protein
VVIALVIIMVLVLVLIMIFIVVIFVVVNINIYIHYICTIYCNTKHNIIQHRTQKIMSHYCFILPVLHQ